MLKNQISSNFLYLSPIIFCLILIGFFVGIFFTVLLFLSNPLGNALSQFEKISSITNFLLLVTNFLVFFTSLIAVFFVYKTFRGQREQWLNESFIRHEAEVLIKVRNELQKSFGAINFFFHEILEIDRRFSFNPLQLPIVSKPPVVTYEKIVKEFNSLLEINDLYNSYQHLCRKHGLVQGMECITILLECVRFIPEKNIEFYKLSDEDVLVRYPVDPSLFAPDTLVVYQMDQRIANLIVGTFNAIANSIFSEDIKRSFTSETCVEEYMKKQTEEFENFKCMTRNEIYKMISVLDKITTYWGGVENVSAMMNKRMRFFQKKIFFKTIVN